MRAAWMCSAVAVAVLWGACGGSRPGGGSGEPPTQPQPPPSTQEPPPPQQPSPEQPAPGQPPPAAPQPSPIVDSPDGGSTRWVRRLGGAGDESVLALAGGIDGSATLLTRIGSAGAPVDEPDALGLVRLDRSGAVIWSRELPNPRHAAVRNLSIAVSPLGNVFVAATVTCGSTSFVCSVDFGGGEIGDGGTVLFKFEPPGSLAWQQGPMPALSSNVAVDGSGAALLVVRDDGGTPFLRKFRWDGVRLWDAPAPRLHDPPSARWVAAFDPDGDVVLGNRLEFAKLDPGGKLLWSAEVAESADASGEVASIGTTAIGTVVAVMSFNGAVAFAGTEGTAGIGEAGFIAVAGSDGAPRFGRMFGGDIGVLAAAVDPAGRLAILTRAGPCADAVWKWNLAGDLVWRRPLATSCGDTGAMLAASIAVDPTSHDLLVGGGTWGTVDFGSGAVASHGGVDEFVVDIAP